MSDLAYILKTAVEALRKAGVDTLLIGGFAVNHYGYTRSTADIDFMIALDGRDAARRAMEAAGFAKVDEHETVVFYRIPGNPVRVDLLKVDLETMKKLLGRAIAIDFHGQEMKAPALEDLIAMKLFALKHGWVRRVHKDLPDIVQLVRLNKMDVHAVLKPLALRFADQMIFEKIAAEISRLERI